MSIIEKSHTVKIMILVRFYFLKKKRLILIIHILTFLKAIFFKKLLGFQLLCVKTKHYLIITSTFA